jgi:hypothetical protein
LPGTLWGKVRRDHGHCRVHRLAILVTFLVAGLVLLFTGLRRLEAKLDNGLERSTGRPLS